MGLGYVLLALVRLKLNQFVAGLHQTHGDFLLEIISFSGFDLQGQHAVVFRLRAEIVRAWVKGDVEVIVCRD